MMKLNPLGELLPQKTPFYSHEATNGFQEALWVIYEGKKPPTSPQKKN